MTVRGRRLRVFEVLAISYWICLHVPVSPDRAECG